MPDYDDVPEPFDLLCPAPQADVVRVWSIARHGGIWLDRDTIAMDRLASPFSVIDSKGAFFEAQNNEAPHNDVFESKPNTPYLKPGNNISQDTSRPSDTTSPGSP